MTRNEIPPHKMYSICVAIREYEKRTLWDKIQLFIKEMFG